MNQSPPDPGPLTRERLLDAAERLFAARGFAGTSVRRITDEAQANLGAINYHFRSKDNLYAEVFARRATLVVEPLIVAARDAAATARTSPDRAFLALGRAFLAPHQDRAVSLRLRRLFAREVFEPRMPRQLFLRQFLEPTIDAFASVVQHARPDLPEADARACGHAFLAQLVHVARGTGVVETSADERLAKAVRFTVAAVRHISAVAPGRPRRKTQRKHPRWRA